MSGVRSVCFLKTQRVANVFTLYYTVPPDRTAIVKEWIIANSTGAAATLLESDDGSSGDNHRMNQWNVAANTSLIIPVFTVYAPGDTIWLRAGAVNTICVTLSGALLEGVAP